MVSLAYIYAIPFIMLLAIIILYYIDKNKKRKLISHPFISFIIPCYNDEKDIEDAVKGVYESYDNFELFVINDKSTDSSLKILKKLNKTYDFTLIENEVNKGKTVSFNSVVPKTKGEIIFGIDADVVLTKKAVRGIIKRFDSDLRIALVSCPYKPKNSGFLARMQEIEYNQLKMLKYSQNIYSVLGAWGGCLAVKRKPFIEVGLFSENMLVEDMDLALKLFRKNYRIEQCSIAVKSDVPTTFKSWFKQKLRWHSGGAQCFLTHTTLYFKNPITLIYGLSQLILIVTLVFFFYKYLFSFYQIAQVFLSFTHPVKSTISFLEYIYVVDKKIILHTIFIKLGFVLFTLPYGLMTINSEKEIYKILYLIPYTIIYSQALLIIYFLGWIIGIKKYFQLRGGRRAW